MLAIHCPKCGAISNHILTDVDGHRYYRCTMGISSFKKGGSAWTDPCDTIINERGEVTGIDEDGKSTKVTLVYRSFDKASKPELKSMTVVGGKEV